MRPTIRCGVARRASPCSSLSTLPGRPPPCSRRLPATGSVFVFFVKISKRLFVRIYTYQSRSTYVHKKHSGVAGRSLSVKFEGQWIEFRMVLFYFYAEYMHTECCYRRRCCCCCCAVCCCTAVVAAIAAAAAVLLLPVLRFVVVCRMAKLYLVPVFSCSSFKRDLVYIPWQYCCVAFTVSICLY